MLSRTADNLYWLARYVERAEYVARILEATQRLTAMPLSYVGGTNEWESAVATARTAKAFAAHYPEANEETAIDFLAFSTANPSSIRNCFEMARTNARAVRTALTAEMWDVINSGWLELKRFGNGPASREELLRFLRWVQETSLRFDGSAYRTMLRNERLLVHPWLGVYLERADNTARILDVKYHLLLPADEPIGGSLDYFQWAAILRTVSALTAYHWVYRDNLKPWLVADLLILNEQMPRSLASCYENLVRFFDAPSRGLWPPGTGAQRKARAVRTPPAEQPAWRRSSSTRAARVHRQISSTTTKPARRRGSGAVSDVVARMANGEWRVEKVDFSPAARHSPFAHSRSGAVDFDPAARNDGRMRIRVSHETVYRYEQPPKGVIQTLRMTPRNHDGQYVVDWRIDVSADCRLDAQEDAFGNITHTFSADGPMEALRLVVDGEVETQDNHGFVRGALEHFPPSLFLRTTPLTTADDAITAFAHEIRAGAGAEPLGVMHALLDRLHEDIVYDDDPTQASTTAAESFALKRGVFQDLTHLFIAAAREL